MLKKILIQNYRQFESFELDFVEGLNVIVGDNDSGKSTVLEAVNLALTFRVSGRSITQELSPYLINQDATAAWVKSQKANPTRVVRPPVMFIELHLEEAEDTIALKGTNNQSGADSCGVRLEARLSPDFEDEFKRFASKPDGVALVPTEYYEFDWRGFSGNRVTSRSLPKISPVIDSTTIRLQSGVDHHMQQIVRNHLEDSERVELSREYRNLREEFNSRESVLDVNKRLTEDEKDLSDRNLTLSVDISQRYTWEGSLVAHLDDLPFQYIGKGEQNMLKTLLAVGRRADSSRVVLLEEPENHLSFASMRKLLARLQTQCEGKQLIVATHSAYVLNKLGLAGLILLGGSTPVRISSDSLPTETVEYFKKLPGYDTMRLALCREAILVEGPSDELVVQRAYMDSHGGRSPLDDQIDVISVGLSHRRFAELAVALGKPVRVVRDNDGHDAAWVKGLYGDLADHDLVSIHTSDDPALHTLEPCMIAANDPEELASIVGCSSIDPKDLLSFMTEAKTDWALRIHETEETKIRFPQYLLDAVK